MPEADPGYPPDDEHDWHDQRTPDRRRARLHRLHTLPDEIGKQCEDPDRRMHQDLIGENHHRLRSQSGAALSPCELDSFEASEAITMTAAIKAITSVQIALISGFTPSRTSE